MPGGNPFHDSKGRFASGSASGAASGDHQAVSPHPDLRNVSGRAIPRSQVATRHAGAQSVGTDGAMTKFGPGVAQDPFPAKANAIITGKGIDQRAKPFRTDADLPLSGPRPIARGKLDPRQSRLISGGAKPRIRMNSNAHVNAVMSASSRPSPRTQPTAGQLIGAGIIKGN